MSIILSTGFDHCLRLYPHSGNHELPEWSAMPNPDSKYQNEDGRVLRWEQVVRYGWKEGGEIERTEDGALVDGDLYHPVLDGDHDAL